MSSLALTVLICMGQQYLKVTILVWKESISDKAFELISIIGYINKYAYSMLCDAGSALGQLAGRSG